MTYGVIQENATDSKNYLKPTPIMMTEGGKQGVPTV
jgi:hypothetical protein